MAKNEKGELSVASRRERASYVRYGFVIVLILLDLFALPWALFFLLIIKLHGIARAPTIWLHSLTLFGGITLIPRVFQLWGWLQLIVGLFVFLVLTSGQSLTHGYNPEGDPTPAGQGQFGSSRWQSEAEIDGNFTVRKIPCSGCLLPAFSLAGIKNRMTGILERRGGR
jgi:type IV secretion system protein VirD4